METSRVCLSCHGRDRDLTRHLRLPALDPPRPQLLHVPDLPPNAQAVGLRGSLGSCTPETPPGGVHRADRTRRQMGISGAQGKTHNVFSWNRNSSFTRCPALSPANEPLSQMTWALVGPRLCVGEEPCGIQVPSENGQVLQIWEATRLSALERLECTLGSWNCTQIPEFQEAKPNQKEDKVDPASLLRHLYTPPSIMEQTVRYRVRQDTDADHDTGSK